MRANINSIGLSESWLKNKGDRTEMETLLYEQLLQEKYSAQISEREKVGHYCLETVGMSIFLFSGKLTLLCINTFSQ